MPVEAAVAAYLKAIFYKYELEYKARSFLLEGVSGIEYQQKMQHPWPRSFDYQHEFFAGEISPSQVSAKITHFLETNPREFVLNVFTSNLTSLVPGYRDVGFQHVWNNMLMMNRLKAKKREVKIPPEIKVETMKTHEDTARVNSMQPDFPASTQSLDDPYITNLYATFDGQMGAKAQAVMIAPDFLYISDMFTAPAFRRKGLSAALLETLQKQGLERGCKYAILVPSRMTREIELYQRYAYTELVPIALFIPLKANGSLASQI